MRDDLLHAQAAVEWAKAHIPILQEGFVQWQRREPYRIVSESDPETGNELIVAIEETPLPLTLCVEVGIIINAIHTSLDLLAASLSIRNGKRPSADTHFPIFQSGQCCFDPITGVQGKKWLSKAERDIIENLKPYEGGDDLLYAVRQLDNTRKHTQLVIAKPIISNYFVFGTDLRGGNPEWQRLERKTILFRFNSPPIMPGGRYTRAVHYPRVTKGNLHLTISVLFEESSLVVSDKPVIPVLRELAERAEKIITLFT